MSARTFAKIGVAIAILLAADFSAAFGRDQGRRRIGRIVRPAGSVIAPLPFIPFSWRDNFDYYGNRKIVPKGPVTQADIVSSLKKRGFRDIDTPRHRGETYVVEATGALGERVRLVINGKSGGIDGVRVIGIGKK